MHFHVSYSLEDREYSPFLVLRTSVPEKGDLIIQIASEEDSSSIAFGGLCELASYQEAHIFGILASVVLHYTLLIAVIG